MAATTRDISPSPAYDPLLAFAALPYAAEFYPHGFPASIRSNSPAVLDAAAQSWEGLGKRFDETPIELRCLVSAGAAAQLPPPPVTRAQGHLEASVADAENFWSGDLAKGFASAWVTEAVATNAEYFRYHFLEAMAYGLLDTLHLVAIHAGCVALDGRGVLLAGDSGAGKSSLAYACARRGWTYVSDDASSLVRRDAGRTVLGNPRLLRFRETAGALFPEFRRLAERRRANGKLTIEVRTESLPAIRTAAECRVDYIVFLNRRDARAGQAKLLPTPKQEALRRLSFTPWPRELRTAEERRAAVERLLDAGIYELRYRDLDAAVDRLQQLVCGGSR